MSATSRLWNILRAQLGPRLAEGWRTHAPRWSERFGADSTNGDRANPGSGRNGTGGTGDGRADGGRTSSGRAGGRAEAGSPGQDPDLARYYANLEVPYGSDLETIEKAWKRLLRKYHPDRHATDPERQRVANELTGQLNHAYTELRTRLKKNNSSNHHR